MGRCCDLINLNKFSDLIFLNICKNAYIDITTIKNIKQLTNGTPVLVSTCEKTTEDMGIAMIQAGAEDCVELNKLDEKVLSRMIKYTIERSLRHRLDNGYTGNDRVVKETILLLQGWRKDCNEAMESVRDINATFGSGSRQSVDLEASRGS